MSSPSVASRPMTRAERKRHNRALHERQMREEMAQKHGPELGAFLFWLRVMTIRGTQAHRDGDVALIRDVALALENVYRRHCT